MSMSGYDAAYPPAHPPNDAVVMGYIGGNTPHVWSLAEWNGQPARYRIPIWTRSNPGSANPATDAANALAKLRQLGAPPGCLVVLDYETAVNAGYLRAFDAAMLAGGHPVCVYGSASTLFGNPKPSGGYFAAQWTGSPHMYPGAVITQYGDVGAWDNDVVSTGLPLWDTATSSTAGADMPLTPADITAIWEHPMQRQGGPTGTVTPGDVIRWFDAVTNADRDTVLAAVAKIATPTVDVSALAAAIAPHLQAGASADQIASAVLQHLSLATAKG